MDTLELLDQIYESSIIPELWPDTLEAVMRMSNAKGGVLFSLDPHSPRSISTPAFTETLIEYFEYLGDRTATNKRTTALMASDHIGFVRDSDVLTPDEIESEPLFGDFLYPRGYGFGVATQVKTPTGDQFVIHFERGFDDGPVPLKTVQQLDRLRGAFARAALLSSRQNFVRAKSITDAMNSIGLAAAALTRGARVIASNALFEALVPDTVLERAGKITLANVRARDLFHVSLTHDDAGLETIRSIPIPATGSVPATIAHLVPVRRAAHDIFTGADFVAIFTPTNLSIAPRIDLLQGLFDLTPAEAFVAQSVSKGYSLDQIAEIKGLKKHTVRNQLGSVFSKTGVDRQADLVRLITSGQLPIDEA